MAIFLRRLWHVRDEPEDDFSQRPHHSPFTHRSRHSTRHLFSPLSLSLFFPKIPPRPPCGPHQPFPGLRRNIHPHTGLPIVPTSPPRVRSLVPTHPRHR